MSKEFIELSRAAKQLVASRFRAQGGNTSDNTTQAAANKAAEEGGLPDLRDWIIRNMPVGMVVGDPAWWADRIVAQADRASRQVANKAEVDLSSLNVQTGADIELVYCNRDEEFVRLDEVKALLATPPATTGASTVLTDERIWKIWQDDSCPGGTVKEMAISHARAVLREVAAQAGQVAVPDGFCEPCQGFGELHGEVCPHCSDNTWQAAPSPAKESK